MIRPKYNQEWKTAQQQDEMSIYIITCVSEFRTIISAITMRILGINRIE